MYVCENIYKHGCCHAVFKFTISFMRAQKRPISSPLVQNYTFLLALACPFTNLFFDISHSLSDKWLPLYSHVQSPYWPAFVLFQGFCPFAPKQLISLKGFSCKRLTEKTDKPLCHLKTLCCGTIALSYPVNHRGHNSIHLKPLTQSGFRWGYPISIPGNLVIIFNLVALHHQYQYDSLVDKLTT